MYFSGTHDIDQNNQLAVADIRTFNNTVGTIDYNSFNAASVFTGNKLGQITRYNAGAATGNCEELIGFRSSITNQTTNTDGSAKQCWNIYADGTASNYFRGFVSVGDDPDLVPSTAISGTGLQIRPEAIVMARESNTATSPLMLLNRISTSDVAHFIHFNLNGSYIDSLRADGSGNVMFGNTSDYRAKENIVDLPSATDVIKALRPVNYNYNWAPGKTRPGFIAHEIQEVLPIAVVGEKDATEPVGTVTDYNGTELETNVTEPEDLTYEEQVEATPYVAAVAATYDEYGNELTAEVPEVEATYTTVTRTRTWTPTGTQPVYQGVDQTKLIPLLTKALQEALDRIDQLESNTLQPLYSTFADLPSASDHHGKVAHVHSEGALYFAHAGNWVKLQNA